MAEKKAMSDAEIRQKLNLSRKAFEHQINEESLRLGGLALKLVQSSKVHETKVGNKQGALTAMYEELSLRLSLIEFIDGLDIDGKNKTKDIREVLRERHLNAVYNLERAAAEVSGRAANFIMTCTGARSRGLIVPLGEKARKVATSEHARMMKDAAIVGFIQQFGISSRSQRGLA